MNDLENRIKEVMSIVFEIEGNTINDESSPDNIPNWDSLKHMMLIGALEDEFEIYFTNEEMMELLNFKLISIIMKEKI